MSALMCSLLGLQVLGRLKANLPHTYTGDFPTDRCPSFLSRPVASRACVRVRVRVRVCVRVCARARVCVRVCAGGVG